MNEIIKDFQKLIDDFSSYKIKELTGLTFLEIAKCPHLENVWSNILAFYLNPSNEHNLHDLMFKAIFQTISKDVPLNNFRNINVQTEYPTEKGNRIDIVAITDGFILGIENKVGARLYNDLQDYSQTIDNIAIEDIPKYKIVLSKYKNETTNGFENIIYADLIKNIKSNLGNYANYSDTKYLIFLLDFLKNIENNLYSNNMVDNQDVFNFFLKNTEKVNKFIEYYNKYKASFVDKLNNVYSLIEFKEINDKYANENGIYIADTPGRITCRGEQLIKYKIIINEIIIFYQIEISDNGLLSCYWFDNNKYEYLRSILNQEGIDKSEYTFFEADEDIAIKIKEQIESIIIIIKRIS